MKAGNNMQCDWHKGHFGDIIAPLLANNGFNLKKIPMALALFEPKTYKLIMELLADFYAKPENFKQHLR